MNQRHVIGYVSFTLLLFVSMISVGQEQPGKRERADQLFERYQYFTSLPLYLELAAVKSPDPGIIERIAECYRKMNQYRDAEKWYARAASLPVTAGSIYYYAEMLLANQKVNEAREQYKRYFSRMRNTRGLGNKLATCDSAEQWIRRQPGQHVENVAVLNSAYADWGLSYAGKSAMSFVSDRFPSGDKTVKTTYNYTGDGWFSLYKTDASAGSAPVRFTNQSALPLFSSDYHVGPLSLKETEDVAFLTVTTVLPKNKLRVDNGGSQRLVTRRMELFTAVKKDGVWSPYIRFPYNQVNLYNVAHAALSGDGNIVYFTSDMPGGEGKTDIWYCTLSSGGTWSRPVNCGKSINTAEEEAFPTMGGNGQLYFSSRGLPGMGGYDIFTVKGEKNAWSKAVNLMSPVNGTTDDFWLTTADGKSGYFSSDREGGKGKDDIYRFEPLHTPVAAVPVATIPADTIPVRAMLPPPVSWMKEPLTPGTTFVLKDIYYDLDKWDIRPDAAATLNELARLLLARPEVKIELSAHTDSRAPDGYNLTLSQRRAESAAAYLIKNGVLSDRIVARGYGETRLLNRCGNGVRCSEEEHQLNRRTEVRIR